MSAATGFSPFLLDLGREPLTPAALLRSEEDEGAAGTDPRALVEKIRSVITASRDKMALEQADIVTRALGGRVPSR